MNDKFTTIIWKNKKIKIIICRSCTILKSLSMLKSKFYLICFERRKVFNNPKNTIWFKREKNEFIKNELPGKQKNIPLFDEIVNSKSTKKVMNKATTQPIILHFYPNFKQTSSQTKRQTEKSKLRHHQLSWLLSTITLPELLHSVQGKRKITKIISNTPAICSAYRLKKN